MSIVLRASWCWLVLVALALATGCATTGPAIPPCVPEIRIVDVEIPVSQPIAVPQELRWPDLPEYEPLPVSGLSEAEAKVWAVETARVAREREEVLIGMLEACLEYLSELGES